MRARRAARGREPSKISGNRSGPPGVRGLQDGGLRRIPLCMELTELPLPPEIWAATPCAAQALILAQRERIRDLEARLGQTSANSSRPASADLPQGVGAPESAAVRTGVTPLPWLWPQLDARLGPDFAGRVGR